MNMLRALPVDQREAIFDFCNGVEGDISFYSLSIHFLFPFVGERGSVEF